MRTIATAVLGFLSIGVVVAMAGDANPDAAEVKALIERCYVNGAFNDLDPAAMREGFHPDFAIFSADGEAIRRYPIAEWADKTEVRKTSQEFEPAKNKWEHNFAGVDVTGGSAAVKLELFKDSKHVYTDYLSLLKFDSGWKIVAKVYHKHGE